MKIQRNVLVFTALSLVWGCSSNDSPVDIGDAKTGQKLSDYAATWEGYAEAHDFEDGSDRVRIVIDAEGNGTLEIGDSAALLPATDPDVGYPAGVRLRPGGLATLFPGISYPIHSATVAEARLQLLANPWEVERDWCALQTSYAVAAGGETKYQCVPTSTHVPPSQTSCRTDYGAGEVAIDCDKLAACSGPLINACACDANGCGVYEGPTGNYTRLDAALETSGDLLVGTLRTGPEQGETMTVRLTRVD